jgi:hypothetical protein
MKCGGIGDGRFSRLFKRRRGQSTVMRVSLTLIRLRRRNSIRCQGAVNIHTLLLGFI